MSEIAKCPICGKEPEVWCRDEEVRIRIVCCKHAVYSTSGWNQYAALRAELTALKEVARLLIITVQPVLGDDGHLWVTEHAVESLAALVGEE